MAYENPLYWPADINPQPDIAYGCIKLKKTPWTQIACQMLFDNISQVQNVLFTADDVMNQTTINAILALGSGAGRATFITNQMQNAYNAVGTVDAAARLGTTKFGTLQPFYFEGGADLAGIMDYMAANVSALNLKAGRHTVCMVVKPTTSLARNVRNNLAPTINTFFELTAGSSNVLSTLVNDGSSDVTDDGFPCWSASAQDFDFQAPTMPPQVNPSVLWYVRDKNGPRVRQNGVMRRLGVSVPSLTDVADTLWIARKQSSQNPAVTPPYIPMNEAGDYWLFAMMVWNDKALTEAQCNIVDKAFGYRLGAQLGTGLGKPYGYKTVTVTGDSIAAEFTTDALDGWLTQCQKTFSFQARWHNMAIAGSPETSNGAFITGYGDGIYDTFVLPNARLSPRGNALVYWHGGNDAYISPQPTPTAVQASISNNCLRWVQAGGLLPIVMTVMNRNDAFQTHRDDLNTAIRNGAGGNYSVADVQAISSLQTVVANPNLPDGTHLSYAGGTVVADFMRPIIAARLGGVE